MFKRRIMAAGWTFDTFMSEEHPRIVKQLLRRAVAFVAVVTIGAGGWAECAGWQATAEARMACCAEGSGCPGHRSESGGETTLTQVAADSCCAAGERNDAGPVAQVSAAHAVPAVVPQSSGLALRPLAQQATWRLSEPVLIHHVPRHLLLSVFLV